MRASSLLLALRASCRPRGRNPVLVLLIAATIAISACGVGPRPQNPTAAALYRDLEREVLVSSAAGWEIDRYEIDKLMPTTLPSICRTPKLRRLEALRWVDAEIDRQGGPVERAYRERGEDIDDVETLMDLTRVRLLLSEGIARAETECPFWIRPKDNFRGRQLLDNNWVLTFGGGGKAIFLKQGSEYDVSGGGAGRLLLGRAFGPHWLVQTGSEIGALAAFPKSEDGERSNLVIGLEGVIPLVVRYRLINSYVEGEAGPLWQWREDLDDPIYGLHIGASFGAQATRRLFVIPGAAFTVSYERTFANGEVRASDVLKMGFRGAIDLPF